MWRVASHPMRSSGFLRLNAISVRTKKSKASGKHSSSVPAFPDNLPVDLSAYEKSMSKTLNALQTDYSRLRVDGATPAILDEIMVRAYGSDTALQNIAQVSARDGRTLMVDVFDEDATPAVEKAIQCAGLNITPVREASNKIRVPIPRSSKRARDAMRETATKDAESARIATRMIRRKAMEEMKALKKEISKDDIRVIEKSVQSLTDHFIYNINEVQQNKIRAIDSLEVSK